MTQINREVAAKCSACDDMGLCHNGGMPRPCPYCQRQFYTARTTPEPVKETRIGDWMQTAHGRFYPLDPRPEEIHIEDIARALSRICRFGGHSRAFYSVAQHSVHVSELCTPEHALAGLLHDAAEAYIGDMVRPLKRNEAMLPFQAVEHGIMCVVWERFDLPHGYDIGRKIAHADEVMLATEARDLMDIRDWDSYSNIVAQVLPEKIIPWSMERAEDAFLARFYSLTR